MSDSQGKVNLIINFLGTLFTQIWKFLKKILLSAITGIIIAAITSKLLLSLWQPESYTVYIAGGSASTNNESISLKGTFNERWEEEDNEARKLQGVNIKIKDGGLDEGKTYRAKQISIKLANEKNTLMVIGHFLSTTTQTALSSYLQA
ncbi:MAG: hypothetical protein IM466_10950, partial [Microcystis sp. M04BS1]|nr:hypothetical protein [Microcystis sp. M04BS1]